MTRDAAYFSHLVDVYFDTRKNKRYGRDSMTYELSWVTNLVRDLRARGDKSLRIDRNYAFLTSIPRWREIMATEFKGRLLDHEICEVIIPLAEKVLSPYTFNNRKGKGAQAAINLLIENIYEVTENYTAPARIIKLDLKGYFPNALWDFAEKCVDSVIDLSDREDKDYLKWLAMVSIHCNPAAHCEYRTPLHFWREHIDPEKSILTKPEGVGAAIGRLIWQTSMGLYINDEVKWLTEECGLKVVCFVDDIVMVVPEHLHAYALSLIPELRRRLAAKGVKLNERKFYDQPAEHGVEFLGSHIKPGRVHLNDKTVKMAFHQVDCLDGIPGKKKHIDTFLSSVNAYTGLTKNRTNFKATQEIRRRISEEWWEFLAWDARRQCVTCKPGLTWRDRMNEKYHLKLNRNGIH